MDVELNLALAQKLWPEREVFNQAPASRGPEWWWRLDDGSVQHVPDFASYEGMGLVIERMYRYGAWDTLGEGFYWSWHKGTKVAETVAATLPQAVFLATCKALGVEVKP